MILLGSLINHFSIDISKMPVALNHYAVLIPNRTAWWDFLSWACSWDMQWSGGKRVSRSDEFKKGTYIQIQYDYKEVSITSLRPPLVKSLSWWNMRPHLYKYEAISNKTVDADSIPDCIMVRHRDILASKFMEDIDKSFYNSMADYLYMCDQQPKNTYPTEIH